MPNDDPRSASELGGKVRNAITEVDNAIFSLLGGITDAKIDSSHHTLRAAELAAIEADEYIAKLERYALDGDAYRCDGCKLVFDVDETVFGEDCHLCRPCARLLTEAAP